MYIKPIFKFNQVSFETDLTVYIFISHVKKKTKKQKQEICKQWLTSDTPFLITI